MAETYNLSFSGAQLDNAVAKVAAGYVDPKDIDFSVDPETGLLTVTYPDNALNFRQVAGQIQAETGD